MIKLNKFLKYFGVLTILLSFILNPWVIEYFFSPDKKLDFAWKYTVILFFDLVILVSGLVIYFFTDKLKKIILNILLFFFSLFICLVVVEILLNVNPFIFGRTNSTIALSKYNSYEEGIFAYDQGLRVKLMKPNFETTNFYYGYFWNHKTNQFGFRDDDTSTTTDIVILGDSFIYGHGVEQNETLDYYLEDFSKLEVANLGIMGIGTYESMILLNKFGVNYQPDYVVFFFFYNDLHELDLKLRIDLPREEAEKFIATPVEEIDFSNLSQTTDFANLKPSKAYFKLQKFFNFYFYNFQLNNLANVLGRSNVNDGKAPKYLVDPFFGNYIGQAIKQMRYVAEQNGAKFILAPIPALALDEVNVNTGSFDFLRKLAQDNNIDFVDAQDMEFNSLYYLEHDGHFSPAGQKEMARRVYEFIKQDLE